MTATTRWISCLAAAALLLVNTGCLDFEQQAIVLVFPKDGKSVQALFVYQGLHVRRADGKPNKNDKDLQDAKEDLAELVRGDSVIFGDRMLRAPLKPRPNEKLNAEETRLLKIFQPLVTIHPGLFLTSDDGKFTYCQPVTLRDPQAALTRLNELISEGILKKGTSESKEQKDPLAKETGAIFMKAAKDGHAWLKLADGRLSLTLPGSIKTISQARRQLFDAQIFAGLRIDLEALANPKAETKPDVIRKRAEQRLNDLQGLLGFLGETPWNVEHRPNQVTISIGWGSGEPFFLAAPVLRSIDKMSEADKELFTYAKTLNVPVRDNGNLEEVMNGFLRTGKLSK